MAIFRWPGGLDRFGGVRYLQQEMERLVGRVFGEVQRIGGGVYPPLNVLNGPDEMIVQCEVPGLRREDLDISITGDTLVVKGVKNPPSDDEKLTYQRRERGIGEFSRTVVLPDRADADRIEATMDAGILTIRIPKSQAAKPRQIHVK